MKYKSISEMPDFSPTGKRNIAKVAAMGISGNPFQRLINAEVARISNKIDRNRDEMEIKYKQEVGNTRYEYGGKIVR